MGRDNVNFFSNKNRVAVMHKLHAAEGAMESKSRGERESVWVNAEQHEREISI